MKHAWTKRDLILLTLLGAVGAAAIFFVVVNKPPALHQGRNAYEWATRLMWPPDQQSKDEAAAALQAMGPDALPLLRKRLAQREPFSRQVRTWLAARLPGSMGRALTRNLKPVSYAAIRVSAANGLRVLGTNAVVAVPDLIRAMRDPDRQVMWTAATALGEMGGAGTLPLIPLLNDPDYNVRHAATYALGQIGPPALAAAPALVEKLGEKNEAISNSAYYSLSRLGAAAGPAVLKLVQEKRGTEKQVAAKALVAVRPRGQLTLPVLVEMAHDTDAASRAAAIEALGGLRISHADALTVYLAGLADTNPAVRLAAVNALTNAPHKTGHAIPVLTELKANDANETVRVAASSALSQITTFQAQQATPP